MSSTWPKLETMARVQPAPRSSSAPGACCDSVAQLAPRCTALHISWPSGVRRKKESAIPPPTISTAPTPNRT